jgi:outer membrane protein assembly factor BamA
MGIALCVAAALLAQAPATEGEGGALTVSSVEVRLPAGADPKLLDRVPSLVAVRQGQEFTRKSVQRTIENLYATGRFADVEVTGTRVDAGLELVIELTPRQSVVEVYAEGGRALTAAEIVEASRLVRGAEYWPERVTRAAEKVAERYYRKGYRSVDVKTRVEDSPSAETEGVLVGFLVEEGEPLRISSVSVVGEPGLDMPRLREALGVRPGDVMDLEVVDKGLAKVRALLQHERFYRARVGVPMVQDGGRLLLPVVAGPRFELIFAGNQHFADSTLAAVLDYAGEELLDGMMASRLAQKLEQFYRFRGFHDVRVTTSEVLRPGTRAAALGFVVQEGPQVRVVELDFDGNTAATDAQLRDVLLRVMEASAPQVDFDVHPLGDPLHLEGRGRDHRGADLPSPPLDTVLVEEAWLEATRAMTALYRQRGYLSGAVTLEHVDVQGSTARGHFKVVEGPQARYHSLTPEGLPEGFTSDVVRRVQGGSPFSLQDLDGVRQGLVRELGRAGYLFAQVAASYRLADEGKSADAVLTVDPGPLVRVRAILPVGNERTYDEVVLRQATMAEGQALDADALSKTQANLMGLGIFRSVEVEMLAPERAEPLKTVLLKTRERARLSGEPGRPRHQPEQPPAGELLRVVGAGVDEDRRRQRPRRLRADRLPRERLGVQPQRAAQGLRRALRRHRRARVPPAVPLHAHRRRAHHRLAEGLRGAARRVAAAQAHAGAAVRARLVTCAGDGLVSQPEQHHQHPRPGAPALPVRHLLPADGALRADAGPARQRGQPAQGPVDPGRGGPDGGHQRVRREQQPRRGELREAGGHGDGLRAAGQQVRAGAVGARGSHLPAVQ